MIRFEFDPSDLVKEKRKFYNKVILEWEDGSDDCVEDMIEKFEDFLIAKGYGVRFGEIQFIKEDE
jgi:hypothetical protein